jgi:ABC-type nitrate/sulfonate/bicarbonate transport system substrate-binding protein
VASERGFWKEEGLEPTLLSFTSGAQINEALLGGSLDFGMGVGAAPAVILASRNAKVVVVASESYADSATPSHYLMVKKDSPIAEVKQLDGKKVAIHAKGTLSHILQETVNRRFGIKPVILEVPSPNQWVALSRGDLDAVMTETPFPQYMETQGGKALYGLPNADVVAYLQFTVSLTSRDFAEKNPEVVKDVVKVILRTARWMMDNPEQARAIVTARLKYTEDVAKRIHVKTYKWSRNGAHLMPSIRWWGGQMQTLNILPRQPNYEEYFVSRYVDAAAKELGKVADPEFDKMVATPLH